MTHRPFQSAINKYRRSWLGAVAVTFGLSLPVLLASGGVAVDTARGWLVKQRLTSALDAAALAAAAGASDDTDEIEEIVNAFLEANYPDNRIGMARDVDIYLDPQTDTLSVSAYADVETLFMSFFGFDTMTVAASVSVKRQVRGLEVVMVLDVTGSMQPYINSLKEAAENFIDILFTRANEPDDVKIGIVPFSNSVNVGPYGLGEDTEGFNYGDPFVEPPSSDVFRPYPKNYRYNNQYIFQPYGIKENDLTYNLSQKGQWHGCIVEDNSLVTEDHEGPWDMYRFNHNLSRSSSYRQRYSSNPYLTQGDIYNGQYGPNYQCPRQPIVPLTSDQDFLLDAIDNLAADGNTLINVGMAWGWRVISPDEPFTEGASYDSPDWEKAVMLMTDGQNTMDNQYSAHGGSNTHSMSVTTLNNQLTSICAKMKAQPNDILIYTVAFEKGVSASTKTLLRNCASDPTKFFDAPDSDELVRVFEQISRELSNLYVTN